MQWGSTEREALAPSNKFGPGLSWRPPRCWASPPRITAKTF